MRKYSFVSAMMLLVLFTGCGPIREKSAEELLENRDMRKQLFTAILQDKDYTAEFRGMMREQRPGVGPGMRRGMMMGDSGRVGRGRMMDHECADMPRKACCCCCAEDTVYKTEKKLRR